MQVGYKETAFGEEAKSNAFGLNLGGAFVFKVSDRMFLEINAQYVIANEKITDSIEEINLKLGGLRTGIGLGLRF
jgi:hypothetical protein